MIACNLSLIKEPVSRVKELHAGFRMLCDSFAISLKEFVQIFSMSEAVFSVWDTDSNGLIDCIEFFTGMIVFANARLEDKLRQLIELFDFNQNGYLNDTELMFLCYNVLSATATTFGVESEAPHCPQGAGNKAYQETLKLINVTFQKDNKKVGSKELIRWVTETQQLKEFFAFIDVVNAKIIIK